MTEQASSLHLAHVHFVPFRYFASPEARVFTILMVKLEDDAAGYPVAELSLYKPGYFSGTTIHLIPASRMETASRRRLDWTGHIPF
jgi:hypothetical protein